MTTIWSLIMENMLKTFLSDFRVVCKITNVGSETGKKKDVFIPTHMIMIMFTKLQCLQSCSVYMPRFIIILYMFFSLDLLVTVEGTANFHFSFRWLFVSICGLRDWFSPSRYIDETPPGGSSGNSSCADNFELSYLVTVQTRVNAQICFRCLSLHGSISSCFCFQG